MGGYGRNECILRLGVRVHDVHMKYLPKAGGRGLSLGYAREVSSTLEAISLPRPSAKLSLSHFRPLNQVQNLRISDLYVARFPPTFGRCSEQFVTILRSLPLPRVIGRPGVHEILEFICKFLHLDRLYSTPPPDYLQRHHSSGDLTMFSPSCTRP